MAKPDLLGIVVRDMAASLKFYRFLGLDIPPSSDTEQHVEVTTAAGFRIAWDTLELMKRMHECWDEPSGNRMVLAFAYETSAEVNSLYERIVQAGYHGHKPP